MIPQLSHCYVILVHYGDSTVTRAALDALAASTRVPDEVVVIDHAEEPLEVPTASGRRVVRPLKNSGYAAGLNIGLGLLFVKNPHDKDVVVCMNNDVHVSPHSLAQLMQYAASARQPHLLGARWGTINPFTGRTQLLPSGQTNQLGWKALSYIDGAFFAAPWTVFRHLKKIPDEYFLYWEESALQTQLRQHNISSRVIPHLGIHHDDHKKQPVSPTHTYYLVRNGAHYLQTYAPWPVRFTWRLINQVRYFYHTIRGGRSNLVRRALKDALHGKLGPKT